jgi:hypothetical protein
VVDGVDGGTISCAGLLEKSVFDFLRADFTGVTGWSSSPAFEVVEPLKQDFTLEVLFLKADLGNCSCATLLVLFLSADFGLSISCVPVFFSPDFTLEVAAIGKSPSSLKEAWRAHDECSASRVWDFRRHDDVRRFSRSSA